MLKLIVLLYVYMSKGIAEYVIYYFLEKNQNIACKNIIGTLY